MIKYIVLFELFLITNNYFLVVIFATLCRFGLCRKAMNMNGTMAVKIKKSAKRIQSARVLSASDGNAADAPRAFGYNKGINIGKPHEEGDFRHRLILFLKRVFMFMTGRRQ